MLSPHEMALFSNFHQLTAWSTGFLTQATRLGGMHLPPLISF